MTLYHGHKEGEPKGIHGFQLDPINTLWICYCSFHILSSLPVEKYLMLLLLSADFFQIRFFKIFFQEHYQSAKLFAKGYQQMTKVAASK